MEGGEREDKLLERVFLKNALYEEYLANEFASSVVLNVLGE